MRILLVDDSRIGREAVKELLELQGHEVIGEAADGSSALAAAMRLHPEAVLVDVVLAEEDGLDVARLLVDKRPDVPVVLMSVDPLPPEEVATSGARGFAIKQDLARVDLFDLVRD
jgi:DNA-binding NarL/FixJ family response regulator